MSHVELRELSADDADELQALLESDPGYTERVTGYPPGSSDAVSLLLGRPEGLADKDKVVLGGWAGDELVSVVDVLRGWPDGYTAHIGLLLVRGNRQGAGLGAATFRALADRARDWAGIRSLARRRRAGRTSRSRASGAGSVSPRPVRSSRTAMTG